MGWLVDAQKEPVVSVSTPCGEQLSWAESGLEEDPALAPGRALPPCPLQGR